MIITDSSDLETRGSRVYVDGSEVADHAECGTCLRTMVVPATMLTDDPDVDDVIVEAAFALHEEQCAS